MTIFEFLRRLEIPLAKTRIPSARMDAEVLLSLALKKDRSYILAHGFDTLPTSVARATQKLLLRRLRHEPIAHIRGSQMFYGRSFAINRHTLIPRPETELIIEKIIRELPHSWQGTFVDVGTGSGVIGITLAREFPHARVIAIDNSLKALTQARSNARLHTVVPRINFLHGNLLEPFIKKTPHGKQPYIIVANLPYVPTKIWKHAERQVRAFEPRSAIDGGADGLKYYRALLRQLKKTGSPPAALWSEIDDSHSRGFPALVSKYFPYARVKVFKDLGNRTRLAFTKF